MLLLEQGTLSCGTTWHAAGLVGPLRASESGTRLVQYSAELYARLEAETGLATGYRQVGGVIVARTEERMAQLRRTAANAAAYDLDCALLTPDEAEERWPVIATRRPARRDLAARRRPGQPDRPHDVARQGRPAGGVRVAERVRVTGVDVADGPGGRHVTGVRTDRGGDSRGRGRRQLRRPVGQGAGRPGRGDRPAALGRALLRRHRAGRGRPRRPADPARPRRLDLLQGGGRRARRRRLRAGRQAVA